MNITEVFGLVSALAAVVSAMGVIFTFAQLRFLKQTAQNDFENEFTKEYRQITKDIPVNAMLGRTLNDAEYRIAFEKIFRYIDFSNEQVFLRKLDQISDDTWDSWKSGIHSNLKLPAFRKVWSEIQATCDSFSELRKLSNDEFQSDPKNW